MVNRKSRNATFLSQCGFRKRKGFSSKPKYKKGRSKNSKKVKKWYDILITSKDRLEYIEYLENKNVERLRMSA
jgi:hypothetical protein